MEECSCLGGAEDGALKIGVVTRGHPDIWNIVARMTRGRVSRVT